MGGSSLLNAYNQIGKDCPHFSKDLLNLYYVLQRLINEDIIQIRTRSQ